MRVRADHAGPNEPDYDPSPLVDGVLGLLEEVRVPYEICDKVVKLIEAWEASREPQPSRPWTAEEILAREG